MFHFCCKQCLHEGVEYVFLLYNCVCWFLFLFYHYSDVSLALFGNGTYFCKKMLQWTYVAYYLINVRMHRVVFFFFCKLCLSYLFVLGLMKWKKKNKLIFLLKMYFILRIYEIFESIIWLLKMFADIFWLWFWLGAVFSFPFFWILDVNFLWIVFLIRYIFQIVK